MKTYYFYIVLAFLMWAYMIIMGPQKFGLANVNWKK
jgi:hypothetical protein